MTPRNIARKPAKHAASGARLHGSCIPADQERCAFLDSIEIIFRNLEALGYIDRPRRCCLRCGRFHGAAS